MNFKCLEHTGLDRDQELHMSEVPYVRVGAAPLGNKAECTSYALEVRSSREFMKQCRDRTSCVNELVMFTVPAVAVDLMYVPNFDINQNS